MTILSTLLARGYFPKELPPFFFTSEFARYATSRSGRQILSKYKPAGNFTECVSYHLALAGGDRRHLQLPHPATFTALAQLTAAHFPRLLRKAGQAKHSKSRPVFGVQRFRALHTSVLPANVRREVALCRAGASYLLKVDVSQFYPSLYTHAVGWALDPKLREKANWRNPKLLGYQLDQALMNLQGKVSQGIPIGNDISFLVAEAVLAAVDKEAQVSSERACRWFDDYHLCFDTRDEAERCLARLKRELHKFRLRINSQKTKIIALPEPTENNWSDALHTLVADALKSRRGILKYFDEAFRFHNQFPGDAVLMYAVGGLFQEKPPREDVARLAQASITQALLGEPGVAQKAFALLTFWQLLGVKLDSGLLQHTIERMILQHDATGVSSDVAWALAFCVQEKLEIGAKAGKVLQESDDDSILLLALHHHANGLISGGFNPAKVTKLLATAQPDGEHWLLAYESARHSFVRPTKAVTSNALFADMMTKGVTFFRFPLPPPALVVHQGGAPEWVVREGLRQVVEQQKKRRPGAQFMPAVARMFADVAKIIAPGASAEDLILELLDTKRSKSESLSSASGATTYG